MKRLSLLVGSFLLTVSAVSCQGGPDRGDESVIAYPARVRVVVDQEPLPGEGSERELARANNQTLVAFQEGNEDEPSSTSDIVEPEFWDLKPRIADSEFRAEVEERIVAALREAAVFSQVASGVSDADVKDYDAELRIRIQAGPLKEGELTGLKWVNFGFWLIVGASGWVVADTQFDQQILVSYSLSAIGKNNDATPTTSILHEGQVGFFPEEKLLNFWQRASWWEMMKNVVIPPSWVASNPDEVNESLFASYLKKIEEFPRELRQRLRNGQIVRQGPGSAPLIHPVYDDGTAILFLFTPTLLARSQFVVGGAPKGLQFDPLPTWDNLEQAATILPPDVYAALRTSALKSLFQNRNYLHAYYTRLQPVSETTSLEVNLETQSELWTWTFTPQRDPDTSKL